jgi:hypothetical protein
MSGRYEDAAHATRRERFFFWTISTRPASPVVTAPCRSHELTQALDAAWCDMRNRRRALLGIGALLSLYALLTWWGKSRRSEASVALVFVGYTNREMRIEGSETEFSDGRIVLPPSTLFLPVPLLRATNNGAIPVQLWTGFRPASLDRKGFRPMPGKGFSHALKPGDSVTIEGGIGNYRAGWWTELSYQRHGLWERIYGWAWDSTNSNVRMTLRRLLDAPDLVRVESGWITSPPPPPHSVPMDAPLRRQYHITAPLSFDPIDLSAPATVPTNAAPQP